MRLGSVFVDLPYLAGFPLQIARHTAGRITFAAPWGQIFHTRRSGTMVLKLIEALRRSHGLARSGIERSIAFIGGFASHHAFDATIHPLVRSHVERDLKSHGGNPSHWHSHCEKHQSLYFHETHFGVDVMGTPYLNDRTRSLPGARWLAPRLPDDLWALFESACLETHARAPRVEEVGQWLRWARVYGWLLSSRLGKTEGISRSGADARRIYYDEPHFEEWVERAQARTLVALESVEELLSLDDINAAARVRFLANVPDVDISVGS